VISNASFNQRTGRATVVPLTTARRAPLTAEVQLPAGIAGLRVDSLLLIDQMRTVSQTRFRRPVYGRITEPTLRREIARRVIRHFDFDDLDGLEFEP
jgi:mRNA-degrading endonuclease toxin of MazEF toxin-antitoxin module